MSPDHADIRSVKLKSISDYLRNLWETSTLNKSSPVMKSTEKITLRPATIDDLPTLLLWDEQKHVIDSDPHDDWNWEIELARQVPWREQLIAEVNNRPIGFIQIIDPREEETHYWGIVQPNLRAIDIWIGLEEDLGKGYGTIMMQLALDRCFFDAKVQAVLIDPLISNKRAIQFYERNGFYFVENRTFGDDKCAVYRIDRPMWSSRKN